MKWIKNGQLHSRGKNIPVIIEYYKNGNMKSQYFLGIGGSRPVVHSY